MSPDPDGVERPHWDGMKPVERRRMWEFCERQRLEHPDKKSSAKAIERVGELVRRFRIELAARENAVEKEVA